jgi:hypothetical protein
MSESRTTAALRRCEWPANRGRTGEPLRCRWRRHGSARIGADAEVGSVRRAKFPRNLPVPSSLGTSWYPVGCPMCTVPDKRGWLPKMRALQRLSHWQARSSLAVVRELQLARRLNLEST